MHRSPAPGEDHHSPDPDWRPENPPYQRERQQGETVVEDGNGKFCLSLDTKVWISQDSTISIASILALEELLHTKSEKDSQDMRSHGVASIYWADTESGLMDIYNLPGVIYATDGSQGSTGMGAHNPH